MDLDHELLRREAQIEEEEAELERLKRVISESRELALNNKLTEEAFVHIDSARSVQPLSTVNNLRTAIVNVPPPSANNLFSTRRTKALKKFSYVHGDASIAFDDDPLTVDDEDDTLDTTTDSGIMSEDVAEISPKELGSRVTLRDERWSMNRPVNALRFQQKHDDVLLSAHGSSSTATKSKTGVVNVWGLDGGHSRLQRTLIANASMTSLALPSLSPTTVIGGTQAGDVLAWDLRAKSSIPIHRAGSVSQDPNFSHNCSPVYSLEMAAGNKAELVSASANGTVCIWSLSNLDSPLTKFQVRNKSLTGTIRVTAIEVPAAKKFMGSGRDKKSSQHLFAGSEDGSVYRFENNGGSWGLGRDIQAHKAPITSLSVHPTSRKWPMISDLVLSASMDWTMKLCSLGAANIDVPAKEFSIGMPAIVTDVKWSPIHPCIFATGDEAGGVALLDAERSYMSTAPPSCRHTFKEYGSRISPTPSISRVQWSKDGRQLSAGDIEGSVSVWRCSEKLVDSSSQEWERLSDFMKQKVVK